MSFSGAETVAALFRFTRNSQSARSEARSSKLALQSKCSLSRIKNDTYRVRL